MRTASVLVLATVAIAAAVSVADAEDDKPSTSPFAGGALTNTDIEGYASPHDAFVTVGGEEGARVPVTATTGVLCGTHRRQVRLDTDATRDQTGAMLVTKRYAAGDGRLRARVTLFARTLGDEATGNVSVTGTLRVPGRTRAYKCRKTSVDWRAHRTDATPVITGPVPHDALMVGTTSGEDQHAPVSPILLRTSPDGTSVQRMKWRVSVPCNTDADDDLTFSFRPYDLSPTSGFVADKHAVDRAGDTTWDTSVHFGGHVGQGGARGYLRVVERAIRGGRTVDTCDTGKLKWSAVLTPPAPAPPAR